MSKPPFSFRGWFTQAAGLAMGRLRGPGGGDVPENERGSPREPFDRALFDSTEFKRAALDYRAKIAGAGPLVCHVGPFDRASGLTYLIAALRELPTVRAVFAGDGPGYDDLARQIVESELEHRVALVVSGAMSAQWRVLLASDVAVWPLLVANRASGELVAHARRQGKPIIVTEPMSQMVGRCDVSQGWVVVPPGDVPRLRDALRRLLAVEKKTAGPV